MVFFVHCSSERMLRRGFVFMTGRMCSRSFYGEFFCWRRRFVSCCSSLFASVGSSFYSLPPPTLPFNTQNLVLVSLQFVMVIIIIVILVSGLVSNILSGVRNKMGTGILIVVGFICCSWSWYIDLLWHLSIHDSVLSMLLPFRCLRSKLLQNKSPNSAIFSFLDKANGWRVCCCMDANTHNKTGGMI